MNKLKKVFDHQTAADFAAALIVPVLLTTVAQADKISDSTVGVGIKNLLSDLSNYIMILSPIVGGLAAGWCVMRRGMADEQDGKMWNKRALTAVICGVLGLLVGGIIKLISSYFT